jgi:hypothetical protein
LTGLPRVRRDGTHRYFLEVGASGCLGSCPARAGAGALTRQWVDSAFAGPRRPGGRGGCRDERPQALPQTPPLLRHHISSHSLFPPNGTPPDGGRAAALVARIPARTGPLVRAPLEHPTSPPSRQGGSRNVLSHAHNGAAHARQPGRPYRSPSPAPPGNGAAALCAGGLNPAKASAPWPPHPGDPTVTDRSATSRAASR